MKTLDDLKDIYQQCYETWAKDKLTHELSTCVSKKNSNENEDGQG